MATLGKMAITILMSSGLVTLTPYVYANDITSALNNSGVSVTDSHVDVGGRVVTGLNEAELFKKVPYGAIMPSNEVVNGTQINKMQLSIMNLLGQGARINERNEIVLDERFGNINNADNSNSISRVVRDLRRIAERNTYEFKVGANQIDWETKGLSKMGNLADLNFLGSKNLQATLVHGKTGFNKWHYKCEDGTITYRSANEECGTERHSAEVTYTLKDDIDVRSVNTKNLNIPNAVNINTNGIELSDKKITGVSNGNVSADSKDAINGSQLNNSVNSVVNVLGGNAAHQNGTVSMSNLGNTGKDTIHDAIEYLNDNINTTGMNFVVQDKHGNSNNVQQNNTITFVSNSQNIDVKVTPQNGQPIVSVDLAKDLKVNSVTTNDTVIVGNKSVQLDKNGVDLKGADINNMQSIGNIHDTQNDLKGVNVKTLRDALQNVKMPDFDLTPVHNRIAETDDKISEGIAGAAASAALPQVFEHGRNLVAIGVGHYRDKQAVAAGFSATTDNGKHIIKLQGSVGLNENKNASINAGYGYSW